MESTGSTSASAGTSLQKSAASSGALSPAASSNVVQEMVPAEAMMFQCGRCPRKFKTAQGLGGHRKAHKEPRQARLDKIEKDRHRRLAAAGQQVRVLSSLLRVPGQRSTRYFDFHTQIFNSNNFARSARSGYGVAPFFPGTGAGGLAPTQPSSAANGFLGIGGGGQVGNLGKGNQGQTAHGIHNWPSLRSSSTMPMFVAQRAGGTSGLAQPSFASPAPAAAGGNGGTGDGVHLGRQHDMPELNKEETTDGIDLTLRL